MNIKDKSQLRAIIKRAITDQELLLPEIRKTTEKKYEEKKGSKKKEFKLHVELMESLTQYSLIIQHKIKHKYLNRDERIFFYFDLEAAVHERTNGVRYPTEIGIATAILGSNLKFLSRKTKELNFINVSTHCIERVIERSGATDFLTAIEIFSPICIALFELSEFLGAKVRDDKRYIVYWHSGYIVLAKSEAERKPVVVTWVPKKWFTEAQKNKFVNLNGDEYLYLIEQSIFNDTGAIQRADVELIE